MQEFHLFDVEESRSR